MAVRIVQQENSEIPPLQKELDKLERKIKTIEKILSNAGPHFYTKELLNKKIQKIDDRFRSLDMNGATQQQQSLHRGLPALLRQVKAHASEFIPQRFDISWTKPPLQRNDPRGYFVALMSHLLPLINLDKLSDDKTPLEKAFAKNPMAEREISKIVKSFDNLSMKSISEIRISAGKEWKDELHAVLLSLGNSNSPTAVIMERDNTCLALIFEKSKTFVIDWEGESLHTNAKPLSIKAFDNAFAIKGIAPYFPYRPIAEALVETEQEREALDALQNNLKIYPIFLELPKIQATKYLKEMDASTVLQKISLLLKIANIHIDPTQQNWLNNQIKIGFDKLPLTVQAEIRGAINFRAQKTVFNNNYTDSLIEECPSHPAVKASLEYLIAKHNLIQYLNSSDFQNALEVKPVPVFLSRKDIVVAIKEKGYVLAFNETQSYSDEVLSKIIATESDKIISLKALHKLLKQASTAPNVYNELPENLRAALIDHYNLLTKANIPIFVDSFIYYKKEQFISVLTKIIDNYPRSLSHSKLHLIWDISKSPEERVRAFQDLINLDIDPLTALYPSENVISWKAVSIKRAYQFLDDLEMDFRIHFRHRLWELTGKERDAKEIIEENPSHPMIAHAMADYLNGWRIPQ